jgi:hypothetical protein
VEALAKIGARLDELGVAPGAFTWPPKGATAPEPYPGLSAFNEDDAGIFFGRDADIMTALTEIRLVRRRRSPRLFVIDAASGAGKSSFLRAGLWPRLKRDPDSRRWRFSARPKASSRARTGSAGESRPSSSATAQRGRRARSLRRCCRPMRTRRPARSPR